MKPTDLPDALTVPSAQSPNRSLAGPADKRLDALRGAVDIRLAALEAALADPAKGDSLEYLILDLARVATEEAQASAARACIDIRLEAEFSVTQAQAASKATIEGERAARAETERALEKARQRISTLEREAIDADQAVLRAANDARAQAHASTLELERTVGRLERELGEEREQLESTQAASTELRRELDRADERLTVITQELQESAPARYRLEQDLAAGREALAKSERAHGETRGQLDAERRTAESLRQSAAAAAEQSAALARRESEAHAHVARAEAELEHERQIVSDLGRGQRDLQAKLETAHSTIAGLRQAAQRASARIVALERQGAEAQDESVRREAETRAAYEHREAETQANFDRLLAETTADREGRRGADKAARERLETDLAAARETIAELQRVARTVETDLDAERQTTARWREQAEQFEGRMTAAVEAERSTTREVHEMALGAEARAAALAQQIAEIGSARSQLAADLDAARLARAALQQSYDALQAQLEAERAVSSELRRLAALQEARINGLAEASETASRQARESMARTEAQLALVGQGTKEIIDAHARIAAELDQERAVAGDLRRQHADAQTALDAERKTVFGLREALDQAGRDSAELLQARLHEASEHAATARRQLTGPLEEKLGALESERVQALAGKTDAQEALGHARAEVQWLRDDLDRARGRIESLAAGRADHERAWRDTEAQLRVMTQDRDELAAKIAAASAADEAALAESKARSDVASLSVPSATPLHVLPSPAYRGPQGKPTAKTGAGAKSPRGRDKGADNEWVAVRLAVRYKFNPHIDVDVSAKTAQLCDLSSGGCQILSSEPLRPKQPVKVTLRSSPAALICTGTVVWANLEAPIAGRSGGYRAGVQFIRPDEDAIEAFIVSHGATP